MAVTLAGAGLTVVDAVTTPAVAAPCLRIGQAEQNNNQQGQNQGQGNNDQQGLDQSDLGQGQGDQGNNNQGQGQGQGNNDQQGLDQNGQGRGDQGQGQGQGGQDQDLGGGQNGQQGLNQQSGQDEQQLQAFGRNNRNPGDNNRNRGFGNGQDRFGNNRGGFGGGRGNNNGNNNGGGNQGGDQGGDQGACDDVGPALSDFADVRTFQPVQQPRFGRNGSRGTFISRCGTNQNGHFNSDNHIVAPGVSNGAQHQHDYVGNLTTSGQSTDESLAAGGTTCARDDRSAYFWPVLRDRTRQGNDANAPGGGQDGNIGRILTPRAAIMEFRGNPQSRVVAAPRFLRMITGDAKSAVNGGANARAGWTCSGFENRISGDKYPLCPRGSLVTRVLDFPSCWDGQNLDSANHRTHVVFPDGNGACPAGTQAIPQLRMTLRYAAPAGPNFAVDAFPDQKHAPITDHADFHNVMPENLMNFVVDCINSGRRC
ncbi:DUF1996 domain-containing protein [Thermopolyspora sp. NPDC052614]|uniref:DUF1996 domain-containing protein n=1 Tax=Thermopolyspora sp. NPDC052614 TaxID=3155682 RepID=UPI00343E9668